MRISSTCRSVRKLQDHPIVVATPIGDDGSGRGPWLYALLALLGVVALLGAVPTAQVLRRRARHRAVAADPVGRGELAWDDAVGALRLLDFVPSATQTPHEFAGVVERGTRDLGPIRALADHVTALRYADDGGDDARFVAINPGRLAKGNIGGTLAHVYVSEGAPEPGASGARAHAVHARARVDIVRI